jgi:DNA-binding winged helix-turn-helix (wHTH) protein
LQTTLAIARTEVTAHTVPGQFFIFKYPRAILAVLFAVCTLIYYFGQVVDFFGWDALKWGFFYEIHDTHRLFFLFPIIYACYFWGFKEMVIVLTASLIVFLPRAILMSPFPDSIARALLFAVFAGILCTFIRMGRSKIQQYAGARVAVKNESADLPGAPASIQDRVFTIGELEANLSKRLVKRRGEIVKLTPKEYDLLSYFIRNTGKALGHAELLHNVWGPEYGQESEYLRTFIWQLRRKLEDNPSNPQFILTEPGVGYRFVEPEWH